MPSPSEPPPSTVTSAERLVSLKRAASAPPELESSSQRIKREPSSNTTPSTSTSFIPPLYVPIMTVKKLPGASNRADVLVYLGKDHIYKVDFQAMKDSSPWMHDHYVKHKPGSCSPFIKDESRSPSIGSERVEGIVAFFELPIGAEKLKKVSREMFLSLLPNTPTIKMEEADDVDIKIEGTEESPTMLAVRFRETTSSTTPQLKATMTPIVYAYKLLIILLHDADLRQVDDHPQPFQDTIIAVNKLIDLCCKVYDCPKLVRPSVANYLHQYRKELFLAIRTTLPKAYVHLVGTYNENHWPWKTPKRKLMRYLLEKIKREADQLSIDCVLVGMKLFKNSIHVEEGGSIVRVSIQSNKDSWTAVSLFRDWLADSLNQADDDPIKRGAIFRKLHKGGDEYMPIWQVYKNMQELGVGFDHEELSNDIKILKDFAKEMVEELCRNNLMLDVEGNGIEYLTCAEIRPEDMPWYGLDGEMVEDD